MSAVVETAAADLDVVGMERFFELSSDLLCIADVSGRFLRVSASWERRLGWSAAELTGRPYLEFVHPEDVEATRHAMTMHEQGGGIGAFVNRYRSRDGEYRYLSWTSSPTENSGLIYAAARDVTEEILHRGDAIKRERQLAEAVRLGRLGFWELDALNGELYWSPEIYAVVGLEPGSVQPTYDLFLSVVHPDDRDAVDAAYGHSVKSHAPYRIDHRLLRKDGSVVWVRERGETVYAPDGTPLRSSGTVQDVTDEKTAHQRLTAERARLRAVMDTIPDLVFIKDVNFRYIGWNKPFLDFCGLTERHLAGCDDFQVFPHKTAQFFRDQDLAMLAGGGERRNEEWVTYPDGRRVLLETVKVPFQDIEGRPAGLVGISRDITERYQADMKAKEREAFYRASIEATEDGFWQLDRLGRVLDVNTAYARMSGYSVAELLGMSINDLDALEDPEETRARISRVVASGGATFESRHRRKDGSVWDVEVSTVYSDLNGGRFFVFVRDMTRRRKAEMLLRTRLHLSQFSRSKDLDQLMTEVLDEAERLVGARIGFFHFVDQDQTTLTLQAWSSNTLSGMCTIEGKGMHYPVAEAGLWADCLRLGRPVIVNDYAAAADKRGMPDGHAPVRNVMSVPVLGQNGFSAVLGLGNKNGDFTDDDAVMVGELAAMAMDLVDGIRAETERIRLAQSLAASAEHWRAAMESHPDGIAIIDGSGVLVRANSAFARLLRRDRDVLTDQPLPVNVLEMLPALGGRRVIEADHAVNPAGVPLAVRTYPVRGGDGAPDGMAAVLHDLTLDRAQEQAMQKSLAELTRSKTEIERFAQVAAHDLQEPTRRQVLFAQLLQRELKGKLDQEGSAYLEFIIENALTMREMVLGFSAYHDLDHGHNPREPVDLNKVIQDVEQTLSREIEGAGARLEVQSLDMVLGDRSRLQLLLINLLSNAVKFRRAEIAPLIRIGCRVQDGMVGVEVADNGIGVPAEYREDLFSMFKRLNGAGGAPGTGIGLAQCRRIVEDLGGTIRLDDNDMGGTSVFFTLPAA